MSENDDIGQCESSISKRFSDLENIFQALRDEQLRSHNTALAKMSELKSSSRDILIDLKDSYAKIAFLEQQKANMEEQLALEQARSLQLEGEKSSLSTQIETIQSVNGQLLARVQQLERDCSDLTATAKELTSQKEKFDHKVTQLRKDNATSTSRIKELETEVSSSQSRIRSLEQDLSKALTAAKTAETRIRQLEEAESLAIMYQV